ncbi:MAG: hypothetical protein AAFZ38_11475 [Myxococcota bacterium]
MTPVWKRADRSDRLDHCPNHEQHFLFYASIYTTGGGYAASPTNQLISNLKADVGQSKRTFYKSSAIDTFSSEVADFFDGLTRYKFALVPFPPSKTKANPDHDDRVMRVASKVAGMCPHVEVAELLVRTADAKKQSAGGLRSADDAMKTLAVDYVALSRVQVPNIVLLGDIITSGASYEAFRRLLETHTTGKQLAGVFWAKSRTR